jgi:hypothetical protein
MGAIFPMTSLKVREGLVKKREKQVRRAAQLQEQASVFGVSNGVGQGLPMVPHKPACTPLEQHNRRRKRAEKQKAEARRLTEDMAVSGAVKDLHKGIRDSVAIIARLPRDELGRVRVYDVTEGGEETTSSRKTSFVFRRFTFEERRALSSTIGKYRSAAKRLSVSVTAAWKLWEATLAEYKRVELIRSSARPGGIL